MKRLITGLCAIPFIMSLTGCGIFGIGNSAEKPPSNSTIKIVSGDVSNKDKVGKDIDALHEEMNDLVGWGRYQKINWSTYSSADYKKIQKEIKTAEDDIQAGKMTDEDKRVLQDLKNASTLAEIAKKYNDSAALLYLHRDVSDLGEWVYNYVTDGVYWGYTYTLNGDHVELLHKYIQEHPVS